MSHTALTGQAQTVLGPITAEAMGITLPREFMNNPRKEERRAREIASANTLPEKSPKRG